MNIPCINQELDWNTAYSKMVAVKKGGYETVLAFYSEAEDSRQGDRLSLGEVAPSLSTVMVYTINAYTSRLTNSIAHSSGCLPVFESFSNSSSKV